MNRASCSSSFHARLYNIVTVSHLVTLRGNVGEPSLDVEAEAYASFFGCFAGSAAADTTQVQGVAESVCSCEATANAEDEAEKFVLCVQ